MESVSTNTQINKLISKHDMVLVYFSSANCGVCKSLLPKLLSLLSKYPQIKAVKAELSSAPELAASFCIFTVPALILFVMGKETLREAGFIHINELDQKIARYALMLNFAPEKGTF